MSPTFGRTSWIFSAVLVLVGILVIVDAVNKGQTGLNVQTAVGIVAIVYGIARRWFYRAQP